MTCLRLPLLLALLLVTPHAFGAPEPLTPPPQAPAERARQTVRDVLAMREFANLHREGPTLTQRIQRAFFDAMTWFAHWLQSLPRWAWWVIFFWLILSLIAILAHLAYTLMTGGSFFASPTTTREGSFSEQLLGERDLDFQELYKRAKGFLAGGDFARAIRYLFVAGLMALERGRWLRYHRSKTDGDYLRELAPNPRLREALAKLTAVFEATTYGAAPPTAESAAAVANLVEGLTREEASPQPR